MHCAAEVIMGIGPYVPARQGVGVWAPRGQKEPVGQGIHARQIGVAALATRDWLSACRRAEMARRAWAAVRTGAEARCTAKRASGARQRNDGARWAVVARRADQGLKSAKTWADRAGGADPCTQGTDLEFGSYGQRVDGASNILWVPAPIARLNERSRLTAKSIDEWLSWLVGSCRAARFSATEARFVGLACSRVDRAALAVDDTVGVWQPVARYQRHTEDHVAAGD
eukprot:6190780-Pleurochrysis_carterae.AAC.4